MNKAFQMFDIKTYYCSFRFGVQSGADQAQKLNAP